MIVTFSEMLKLLSVPWEPKQGTLGGDACMGEVGKEHPQLNSLIQYLAQLVLDSHRSFGEAILA